MKFRILPNGNLLVTADNAARSDLAYSLKHSRDSAEVDFAEKPVSQANQVTAGTIAWSGIRRPHHTRVERPNRPSSRISQGAVSSMSIHSRPRAVARAYCRNLTDETLLP